MQCLADPMRPAVRKIIYALSFETIGVVVASVWLLVFSPASVGQSVSLSVVAATIALGWSYIFNSAFEAWEARRAIRGRPWALRTVHALIYETGLVVVLVPVMAWWLSVSLIEALAYEAGLIVLFVVYTYVFTWGFDRIFCLPQSAR